MSLKLNPQRGNTIRRGLLGSAATALIISLSACQTLEGLQRDLSGQKIAPRVTAAQSQQATLQMGQAGGPYTRTSGATLEQNEIGYGLERGPRQYVEPTQNGPANSRQTYTTSLPSDVAAVPVLTNANSAEYSDGISRTAPPTRVRSIEAYVAPLPLPQFVDIAFGEMLQVPFVIGKDVSAMTDVVQLRSSGKMTGPDFQTLVTEALKEYGVRVVPENGSYKIIQDAALRSRIPKFIKSRARARTRSDLRPIIQFVEMQAVDANSMYSILMETFQNKTDVIRIKSNPQNNYLTLSGLPEDVNVALSIISELDELEFAGSQVKKYTPQYWNVNEFSKVVEQALAVEGWEVTSNPGLSRTIFLMPVEYSNDLFIFAKTAQAHARVTNWLAELDRPVQGGDTKQIYIYQVKNVAAEELANTANSVLSDRADIGGISTAQGALNNNIGGNGNINTRQSSGGDGGGLTSSQTRFTVDASGNRIVFTGTSSDYAKLRSLLEQLDTPAPEVLIEVQIAEVSLVNNTNLGLDFRLSDIGLGNVTATAETAGIGVGSTGLSIGLLGNDIDATLNAFASNRRVKLLSTPILTARSGSTAEIQVGQDIPVLSSQRASNVQDGVGQTDILQSIEYRKTGVLLSIEPIVFSDNRIDLTIAQEVSSELDTGNSSISSPTISNRSLSTQLSLEDGQTAVMGGLIQRSFTVDDKGVPFFKDIPLVGRLFSSEGLSEDNTELVVLITAYVLRGQTDKDQFVRRLSGGMDQLLADDSRMLTLQPRKF